VLPPLPGDVNNICDEEQVQRPHTHTLERKKFIDYWHMVWKDDRQRYERVSLSTSSFSAEMRMNTCSMDAWFTA
jgi:hypothetical protein